MITGDMFVIYHCDGEYEDYHEDIAVMFDNEKCAKDMFFKLIMENNRLKAVASSLENQICSLGVEHIESILDEWYCRDDSPTKEYIYLEDLHENIDKLDKVKHLFTEQELEAIEAIIKLQKQLDDLPVYGGWYRLSKLTLDDNGFVLNRDYEWEHKMSMQAFRLEEQSDADV